MLIELYYPGSWVNFMNVWVRKVFFLAMVVAPAWWGGTEKAYAAADDNKRSGGAVIESIVVTAQKRESDLIEVPMSVTALGESDLQKIGAESFEDYSRFVSNVSFIHRGEFSRSFQPNIRGVQLGRESPTTAFYINETPLQPLNFTRIGLPDPNMFDVERVEILKGPQGTLYGSGSMGGAVKVVLNRPDSTAFEFRVQADLSQVTEGGVGREISGVINLPLIEDKLALRVVGTTAHEEGYIKGVDGANFVDFAIADDFLPGGAPAPTTPVQILEAQALPGYLNEGNFYDFRAMLEWTPNDQWTIMPMVYIWDTDEAHGRVISPGAYEASNEELLIFPVFDGIASPISQHSEVYNLEIRYQAEWAEFVSSITSFSTEWLFGKPWAGFFFREGVPLDVIVEQNAQAVNGQDGEEEQFIFELRGVTSFDGPFNITAGVFYRDLDRPFTSFLPGTDDMAPFLGGFTIIDNERQDKSLEEMAIFSEVTFEVGDQFEVTAGVRWSDYTRKNSTSLENAFFSFPAFSGEVSEEVVNFSTSASWFMNDRTTFYVRAAEGFRPGFVASADLPAACDADLIDAGITPGSGVAPVESDSAISYESGIKTRLFNNRLSLNASAYFIDWEDIQVDIRLGCLFSVAANAGQAEIKGFELELQANPTDSVLLSFAVGLADSELKEDAPGVGGSAGEPLPQVGEWTYSAAIDYYPSYLSSVQGYIRLDYTFSDESLFNFRTENPRPRDIKEKVSLVNVRLGFVKDDWDFNFYIDNVANELKRGQCVDTSTNIPGERTTCVNVPRTFGVRIGRDF